MKAIEFARTPRSVSVSATIQEAIPAMRKEQGCAVPVLDGDRLAGTLSKDDVLMRVLVAGRDSRATTAGDVMTVAPVTVTVDADTVEALRLMLRSRQCYLPVVDAQGDLKGWLTLFQLL